MIQAQPEPETPTTFDPDTFDPDTPAPIGPDIPAPVGRYPTAVDGSTAGTSRPVIADGDDAELVARFSAHELKGPLRAIETTADYLARKLLEGDFDQRDVAGLAADIGREAASVSEQIDDLRSLDNPAVEGLVAVDLNRVVGESVNRFRATLDEIGARVTTGSLPTVSGRPGHLRTVVGNIVGNAVRYRSHRPLRIHITSRLDGDGHHLVAFADNGRGIDPADHGRVFTPYGRAHPDVAGTGLGLALARRIMDRLGGSIWVESCRDQGATFYLRLAPGNELEGTVDHGPVGGQRV